MKHLCLINENSRASIYGIGTYIRQLSDCIKEISDIYLHIINLKSDVNEVKLIEHESYTEYFFPSRTSDMNKEYYRDIWYVLNSYLKSKLDRDLIIHINYLHQSFLIEYIRKDYPFAIFILSIHYLSWSFSLKGNLSHFRNLIHGQLDENNYKISFDEDVRLFMLVDCIICLSYNTKNILTKEYHIPSNKIKVIYNGLKDESRILSDEKKIELKVKMHFQKADKIILFVGRLDPIKGVDILINSFKYILDRNPTARLVIVGDGDYSYYLKECTYYWGKIVFTGRLNKEDLYKLYQIADVGVLPSMHEQCSYVAIEMLMFDIPLVISTTTGLNEVLDNDSNYVDATFAQL